MIGKTQAPQTTSCVSQGARARVEAVAEDGELVAKRVVVLADEPDAELAEDDTIRVEGVFETGDEESWTISGVEVETPEGTKATKKAEDPDRARREGNPKGKGKDKMAEA